MCGIAGVAALGGRRLDAGADLSLKVMADLLTHRGPDEREILKDDFVGLAFTRLSLVDPVGGGQPLISNDGTLALIANGEVYNWAEIASSTGASLRTKSDCEILLHLYQQRGLSFLDDVRGMFAIVIVDRVRNQLILARDRFGIKPLYFHRDARRMVFGSEIKSLFADPATPHRLNWDQAMATPSLAEAPYLEEKPISTWFAEIESVPAATVVRIDLATGHTVDHRYWQLPQEPLGDASPEDLVSEYAELLSDSVKDCVTADAEVGLFLSGGVDSAAVAALSAKHGRDIHTFTVLNASTLRNGDAQHARWVADSLDLPNHQVVFDSNSVPAPVDWKRLLWLSETPMCGPEVFYKHELHRFAKAARPEIRGMLLGAASDEFNGGYTSVMTGGAGWPAFERIIASMASASRLLDAPYGNHWWAIDGPKLVKNIADRGLAHGAMDPYHAYLNWEYRRVQQYNVWHEDRTAAGSGIEARVPFLDHRLVELSTRVPRHLRSRLLWDKNILRDGLGAVLADETVRRPKGPFFYGAGLRYTYRWILDMLLQDDAALMQEAFAAPDFTDYVDRDVLSSTVTELRAGESEAAQVEIALRLVNLGLLSAMSADVPKPLYKTPVVEVNRSIDMTGRTFEDGAIESAVGLHPAVKVSDVPVLAPGVLLLMAQDGSGTGYVALDGSLEFEIENCIDDDFWQILAAVDNETDVRALHRALKWDLPHLTKVLLQLVDDRVLSIKSLTPASAPSANHRK